MKQFLAHPVPHNPGTHFLYNTLGSYVLSAIVTKVTGQTVLDYLKPRLFEPLGIEDPAGTRAPKAIRSAVTGFIFAPKTSPSSASSICKKENGMASS